jgi:hypothetical protein
LVYYRLVLLWPQELFDKHHSHLLIRVVHNIGVLPYKARFQLPPFIL